LLKGGPPAGTPPAGAAAAGRVRRRTDRSEHGVAAGLLRIRDPQRRNLAGGWVADYWSKYEFGWHRSPTANQHDAVTAVELALVEAQRLLAPVPRIEHLTDPDTGQIVPITPVTDNGGPLRSFRFGALIASRGRAAARAHPSEDPRPERGAGAGRSSH
jgi:hypothetical protein